MQRSEVIPLVREKATWDLVVIGGGATGLGTAVDAAQRGLRTLLVEQDDFCKGTSSRSTKLVHGGVRYLQQGNVRLVVEALRERARLLHNAPHLVQRQSFLIPCYSAWERPYYRVGLGVYDRLAGRESFGRSESLGLNKTRERIARLHPGRLRGGVLYYDGQFDDARLATTLALTARQQGATLLNYAQVVGMRKSGAGISGVDIEDRETGEQLHVTARVVVNATGIFVDQLRRQDEPEAAPLVAHSQGVHLVLDRECLGGNTALMVPRTEDGRVLFVIPWHDKVVVGTTDTPIPGPLLEPRPLKKELDFLLRHVERYLDVVLSRDEVRSVFVGIRPLVKPSRVRGTKQISREHLIEVSPSGLITVTGGKWTTYRQMASDTVDTAIRVGGWNVRPCGTSDLRLYGSPSPPETVRENGFCPWRLYGTEVRQLKQLVTERPELGEPIHPDLPYRMAEVVWAARHEMARTLDDVLARRTRCLLLDARAARQAAPHVAALLAEELGRDSTWVESQLALFDQLASGYQLLESPK
jgi:glycerol-3-phosphate dehydrogenase